MVEFRIFQIVYFRDILNTVLVPYLTPVFYTHPILQSVREKKSLGNLSPAVIKSI